MIDALRDLFDGPWLGGAILLVCGAIGGIVVFVDLAVQAVREFREHFRWPRS